MAKINLLPWRQELRKQRQQEFIGILFVVVAAAVGIIFFFKVALTAQVDAQTQRNQYIRTEISTLDQNIKEIDTLQKRKDELTSRMKVIQDLQGRRPVIVRVFDELVRVIPDGVYLTSLDRQGNTFKMTGVAESANQVSAFMRNLEASPWFTAAVLSKVSADNQGQGRQSSDEDQPKNNAFSLSVDLDEQGIAEANKAEAGKKAE